MLHGTWQEVGAYKCSISPLNNCCCFRLPPAWAHVRCGALPAPELNHSSGQLCLWTDVIYVVLTWQWSLKVLWSQPSCPLRICPYDKVEPAVFSSTKLTRFSFQCFCSQSSTFLCAMFDTSLKVFTSDVFPSVYVRVGCFFTQSPSCSLESVLAVSAALVRVSHQTDWLVMIHVLCYPFHIILQHFFTGTGAGSFVENLDFSQSLTHWPWGQIHMLVCWTLKRGTQGSVSGRQHISINSFMVSLLSNAWIQAQHWKTGENIQMGLVARTVFSKWF